MTSNLGMLFNDSWMYWTDVGSDTIERASMNGNSRTILHSTGLSNAYGLTLDYESQTLYWADQHLNRIESSAVNGSDRQIIVSSLRDPYGLTFYQGILYWIDTRYRVIYSFSIESSPSRVLTLTPNLGYLPYYIQVISEDRQPLGVLARYIV